MDIREHSSQFSVYVFTPHLEKGAAIKVALSQAGYDAYYFEDAEMLEQGLRETTPHFLVFSTLGLEGSLSDFVEHVRAINENIRFILLADLEQFDILSQYNAFGVEDILAQGGEAVESRVLWAVDRACERLYLTFQNEQLFDQWKETQDHLAQAEEREREARTAIPAPLPESRTLTARIADYKSAQSKEELIQKFMNQSPVPSVYFKFLPTVGSFVATHSKGFDANLIQGVGAHLSKEELKDLHGQIVLGLVPPGFSSVLLEAFQFNPGKVMPLYVHNHLEGVVAYGGNLNPGSTAQLTEEFSLFSLAYSHFSLEKKVDHLEVQDFITEVYNRNFYQKSLQSELERARRQRQPLSVVKLAIDDFYEIEQSQGEAVRDSLLKALAEMTSKSSRSNDLTCRTQMNEFAMVLPNCSRKGAALRAERLRRMVEGARLVNDLKISISLGISEFPSMCDSAESLDATSSKALIHIIDKGGNKICLYKAPSNHTPEFEVPVE